MPATRKQSRRLSDAELQEMLELTKGADSVELKLTVPDSDHRSTVNALGMDPLDAQIRQIYFFDTPDLVCNRQGVVVRARRVQGRSGDSVIKLRPVIPNELPDGLRSSKNLVVEVDAMPGGFVCSASLKGTLGNTKVKQVATGERAIRKLFSSQQRAFFAEHAPGGIALNDLSILGPIYVFKLRFKPSGYKRRLVAELWMYPDNSRILELSTKCLPGETLEVALETRLFLTQQGVDLSGEQQTKTKAALEFFQAQHEPGGYNRSGRKKLAGTAK